MEETINKNRILNEKRHHGQLGSFFSFIKYLTNLDDDKADDFKTINDVKNGVSFRGSNLWILIFAIFIASIGLNVNSPAVIIGAMLISPLMGPITGIGLGIGINDLELIKKGLFNLAIAVIISVITSSLYFLITPLGDAQSELLARTTPTLWDVLIATFGGLAGIIAYSRKDKSNAIPGVAIATALMPPLCTAGYGLATGNLTFFFGAFYLFFINSVFICFSTFIIVRYLKYPKKEFENIRQEKRVKNIILTFAIITALPSTYTGYKVVQKSLFERNARNFIQKELVFKDAQIINNKIKYNGNNSLIEVIFLGNAIPDSLIKITENKLPQYGLAKAKLLVHQGYNPKAELGLVEKLNKNLKASIIEELYTKNDQVLKSKDHQITVLEAELIKVKKSELPISDISNEIKIQYPLISEFSISKTIYSNLDSQTQDTLYLAYTKFKKKPRANEIKKLTAWLKIRTKAQKLKLITN